MVKMKAPIYHYIRCFKCTDEEAHFKVSGIKKIFFYCNKDGLFSIDVVKGIDDREKSYDDTQERRELEKTADMLFSRN